MFFSLSIYSVGMLLIFLFFLNKNCVYQMFSLFLYTIFVGSCLYKLLNDFWIVALLVIVTMTGLFLIFTYITSVIPESPENKGLNVYMFTYFFLFLGVSAFLYFFFGWDLVFLQSKSGWAMSSQLSTCYKSNFFLSAFLISLLLVLVIWFIRLTYGKSGSLRKKY